MRSWGDSRTCLASVIRDIMRGALASRADPHGLRLRGARISGRLDLENLSTDINLELKDCFVDEGLTARGAHLASVALIGCRMEHPAEPPLDADRLTCSSLILSAARIISHAHLGAVRLTGAHIGDNLECDGAQLRNDSGPALHGERLQVGGSMFLRNGFMATGAGELGAVRLTGADIGDNLECDGAQLRNDSGPALHGERLQVGGSIFLHSGFIATGAGELGAVRLLGAHIGGDLGCDGAQLRNDSGPALRGSGLQVGRSMFLRNGFMATGAGELGAVRLLGAHIGGDLACNGAQLRNDSGPALHGERLQVGGSMFLRNGFMATGAGELGAVRLLGAHIGGDLGCDGAQLRNDSGPALRGSGLQVGRNMFLRNGFMATGAGELGAVRLLGAHISGDLACNGTQLRNDSGPAFHGDRLQVGGSIFLHSGFIATGAGELGAVRLLGAHISGDLACDGTQLRNDSGPALQANSLQVDRNILFTGEFAATGGGDVAVDLISVRVGGTFLLDPKRLEHAADPHRRLALDRMTYAGVPQLTSDRLIPAQDWVRLLRDGTPGYAAQPYQQLAAGHRALGHERDARKILIAQRDDQLARTHTRWSEWLWGRITKVTLGYGYQPWRALLFLAAVVVLSCLLAVALGSHGALAQTSKTATPGRSCTVVQQASVGLDLNLPVGTSIARADCDLTRNSTGMTAAWLISAGWVLRLLAWVFAALFIAGFTSAVRKT